MSRRRTRRRTSGAFGWPVTVLLVAFNLGMGAVLVQDHGWGPIIVGLIIALVFGVFLSSRRHGRRRRA